MSKYTYDYPMPSCTSTAAIFCCNHVLLIKRKEDPFKDCWALPGGFMNLSEDLLTTCVREVREETSLELSHPRFQYHGMRDEVERDPRGRVIDHVYSAVISFPESLKVKAADDATEYMWHEIDNGQYSDFPKLAFDHERSLRKVINERGALK